MTTRSDWRTAARCRTANADQLFVTGAAQREVRAFCRVCPVRTECLAYALDERIEFGVWGGMTERERRALLRARPDVASWRELLADARAAHATREVPARGGRRCEPAILQHRGPAPERRRRRSAACPVGRHAVAAEVAEPGRAGDAAPLTERETQVLRLVVDGLTGRQIAGRLVLSPRTVENHVQRVLRKLGLPNRAALVRHAVENGLV